MLFILIVISLIAGLRSEARAPVDAQLRQMRNHKAEPRQSEAQSIWEEAIAAKGGRTRLHAVSNLIISSRAEYRTASFKKNTIRQEALYVLPRKFWLWNDLRPAVFGLTVTMYNFETNMKYAISEGEPNRQLEPIPEREKDRLEMNGLLTFLLETKWLKPVVLGVSRERTGLRTVDIVETRANGKRVDFALDQKTHLPVRVSFYDVIKGKTYITAVELSDYVNVNGIKVPQKVKQDDGTVYNRTYRFNVDYNEDIFVKPSPLNAGPEAWKPRSWSG